MAILLWALQKPSCCHNLNADVHGRISRPAEHFAGGCCPLHAMRALHGNMCPIDDGVTSRCCFIYCSLRVVQPPEHMGRRGSALMPMAGSAGVRCGPRHDEQLNSMLCTSWRAVEVLHARGFYLSRVVQSTSTSTSNDGGIKEGAGAGLAGSLHRSLGSPTPRARP